MTPRTDQFTLIEAALAKPGAASSDFDLNPETVLPENRKLRDAAVLIALSGPVNDPHVVLTKRASGLKHHPGQIAFPGGKKDPTDADLKSAALREAHEEIALPPSKVSIIGNLPSHETVTGFTVTPFVARVTAPFDSVAEAGEVAEVFSVPFSHLADPANYVIEGRFWRGHRRLYYAVPYGPYYIWGATARMLRALADRIAV